MRFVYLIMAVGPICAPDSPIVRDFPFTPDDTDGINPGISSVVIRDLGSDPIVPSLMLWVETKREEFPASVFETLSDVNPHNVKEFSLGRLVGSSRTSAVYTIEDSSQQWVVKYSMYCPGIMVDPIEREKNILKIVNSLEPDIAPKYLFSSDPISYPGTAGKVRNRSIQCRYGSAEIKYIITERMTVSVNHAIENGVRFPIANAAEITLQTIRLLRRLHSVYIYHGDIHPGNVVLKSGDKFGLIDFGRADIGPTQDDADAFVPHPRVSCHGMFSMWESRNELVSYRDDIFRAIQMLAQLIHGNAYTHALGSICNKYAHLSDYTHYLQLKETGNFFDTSILVPQADGTKIASDYFLSSVGGIGPENVSAARDILTKILLVTRKPQTPMHIPEYTLLEDLLADLISLTWKGVVTA